MADNELDGDFQAGAGAIDGDGAFFHVLRDSRATDVGPPDSRKSSCGDIERAATSAADIVAEASNWSRLAADVE